MTRKMWRGPLLALAAAALGTATLAAGEQPRQPADVLSFGTLQAPKPEEARKTAQAWLTSVGKTDAESQKRFAAIWNDTDRPLLDKVADTLALGNADAAKLLADVRNPALPAPQGVPPMLADAKLNPYLRANLAVAYAQSLSHRKIYDEALLVLSTVKPEQTVDPATYLFNRAVAEYSLMMKKEATESIFRLLDDVAEGDAPERYRKVAALMHFDMVTWQDKDLDWVSRKMGIIQNRLELTRGGQKTQKLQKEVLVRLDEMIKEKENQAKNQSQGQGQGQGEGQGPNDGNCPSGGQQSGPPNGNTPSGNGAQDSGLPSAAAKGEADAKAQPERIEKFGSPIEKDRAEARAAALKELPPEFKDAVEAYLEQLQKDSNTKK